MKTKIQMLEICINLLSVELEKSAKKHHEIDTIINEDYTLTEKQFNKLDKKREFHRDNKETIEYGIRILQEQIDCLKYQNRMRTKDV